MILVIGRHRFDVSRTLAFCGRHRVALMLAAMLLVLSMSASVCAMQSGGTLTARPAAATASSLSGGWCPRPPHRDLNYRARYNYAAFNSCDWFMTFEFTNVRDFMTEPQAAAVSAWTDWFQRTRDGFVRFPAYKRLWSRSEIGQPI